MPTQAVIAKNVASLYREPSSDTERVTQALMGQPAEVVESRDNWRYIRTWDDYHGWIEDRWLRELEPGEAAYASTGKVGIVRALIADLLDSPDASSAILTKAVVSTELEVLRVQGQFTALRLPARSHGLAFVRSGDVKISDRSLASLPLPPTGEELVAEARRFIGVPYLWGGTSPFGLDCSGFVQLVYRVHGVTLPRDAGPQSEDRRGRPAGRQDLRPGDLVFFAKNDRIAHVGMSLGGDGFIHSAGEIGVTVSSLNEEYYKRIYWGGKRIEA